MVKDAAGIDLSASLQEHLKEFNENMLQIMR